MSGNGVTLRRRQLNFIRTESELYRILVDDETITSSFILQLLSFRYDSEPQRAPKYALVLSDGFFYYEKFVIESEALCSAISRHEFDCFCLIKVSSYQKREIAGQVAIYLLEVEKIVEGDQLGQEFGLLIEIPIIEISMDSLFEENTQTDHMNAELDSSLNEIDASQSDRRTEENESPGICEFCAGYHGSSPCPYLIEISSSDTQRSHDEVGSESSRVCSECGRRRSRHSSLSSLSNSLNTIVIDPSQASSLNTIRIGSTQSGDNRRSGSQANQGDASESDSNDHRAVGSSEDDMDSYFDDSFDDSFVQGIDQF